MVIGDGALVVVSVDLEQRLRVLRQAHRCDALGPRRDPVVLQDLLLALGRVRQHADDVDAGAAQGQEVGVLGEVDDRLDQVLLLDERDAVLVGADVANGPECGPLLQQGRFL